MSTMAEQETTITVTRDDAVAYIYSANPYHVAKLRKDKRVVETKGGDDWGQFEVPMEHIDVLRSIKPPKRKMSDEAKAKLVARLAEARKQ